jgi:phytoene synthase
MRATHVVSRLTRRSRSNFYYAFLTLPRAQRQALYAVYAFCRTVDDVVDLGDERGTDPARRRDELQGWRRELAHCYIPGAVPERAIGRHLAAAVRAFPIPREALEAIVDGVEMDLDGVRYERAEDLYLYCYRVASAVGLAAIEIFGYRDPRARDYAVNLGLALQLTNILRDVGTDAQAGRVYLPQADLRAFGVSEDDLRHGRWTAGFVQLMERQAGRARHFYRQARAAYPRADGRSLVAAEVMGAIYFALLEAIEAQRFQVFGERITVPTRRKAGIAVRCWLSARLGAGRGAA